MADNIFQKSPFSLPENNAPLVAPTIKPISQSADTEFVAEKPADTEFVMEQPKAQQKAATPAKVAQRGVLPTRDDITRRAQELGVDPGLALSFFSQESSGNWNSKDSPKGARGGMQVMPGTYQMMMGTKDGQDNPWNNMEAGLRYIAYGQKKLGTTDPALLAAGYHSGFNRDSLKKGVIPDINDGMINTRDYAKSVAARLAKARSGAADTEFVPESSASNAPDTEFIPETPVNPALANNMSMGLPRDKYEQAFRMNNPGASQLAVDFALKQYDDQFAARTAAKENEPANKFAVMNSPEAWFRQRLDKRLAGEPKGIMPPMPTATDTEQLTKRLAEQSAGPVTTGDKLAYLGRSLQAGGYDMLGAGAKMLDVVNPWTLSESDAAALFKDDPAKLKQMQDESAAMILSRFSHAMSKAAEETMNQAPGSAKAMYGSMEYATTDLNKAAYTSPVRVISDVVRNLPTMAAMAVSTYFTRGAAAQAERSALASGASAELARKAGIEAGKQAMARVGAATEGGVGYAQQAEQAYGDLQKTSKADMEKSPLYQELIQKGYSPEAARAKVIAKTSEEAGMLAGIVDASVNKVGGEFLGKILTEGGRFIPRVMKGAANEAATETVQSAGEQAGQNMAIQQNVNPNKSIGEGVAESAVQGLVVGGVSGGATAGVGGRGHEEAQPQPAAAPQAQQAATGPLARATEKAVTPEERVKVETPQGSVTGKVAATAPGAVQIVGDDGQVYNFKTGPDGVKITPEAPNTPLSNALEAATSVTPELPAKTPEQTAEAPKNVDADIPDIGAPSNVSEEHAKRSLGIYDKQVFTPDEVQRRMEEYRRETAALEQAKAEEDRQKSLSDMTEDELRQRLKYLAEQGKTNGWGKALMEQRRLVEREINSRAKEETQKTEPTLDLTQQKPAETAPASKIEPEIAQNPQKTEEKPVEAQNKPQTISKEEADHLFGVDAKRAKALDRIAAGRAWFNDGVKAKDFVKKNGLSDTHEAVKGKGGRWDIVAKAEKPSRETITPANDKSIGQNDAGEALYQRADGSFYRMHNGRPDFGGDLVPVVPNKTTETNEASNATNTNTQQQPTSAEAVEQKASAGQAEAAPVQSVAAPEVAEQPLPADKAAQLQEAHKALGRDVTRSKVQSMRDRVAAQIESGTENNGGVVAKLTPKAIEARKEKLARLDSDLALFDGKAPEISQTVSAKLVKKAERNTAKADAIEAAGGDKQIVQSLRDQAERDMQAAGAAPTTPEVAKPQLSEYAAEVNAKDKMRFAGNKLFTVDRVEAARARMKSKLNQLNAGIDPELLVDGMTIAGAYIEAGTRKFSEYAKAMVEDFGPKIKPYLLSFYEGVRNYPELDTNGMTPVAEAKAEFDKLNTTTEDKASTKAEGNDNGPQKLDQSGSGELAGEQPNAVQGAEPQREAGASAEGRSGADTRGNERAGGSGNEQPGRMGNDAGEVSTLATRRNSRRGGKQGGSAVQRSERPAKPDTADGERGNQPELIPADGTRAQDRADGFVITDEDAIGEGGAKTKFKQNVAAIRLLKQLTEENRQATRAEQAVLAKYVGWGGIPQAFFRDNGEVTKGWEKEAAELKELMTAEELAAAASSTRNAHYTSPEIVGAVWDAAKHFGFQGGRVLEPSVGVGNFFGLMPTALRSASQLTGVELDHITGGIAKQLYPQANIQAPVGFQDFSAPDNYFELAIGNPPFGREGIYDATRRKISGFSIHNYFFAKSIDTVKPNGVLAMVVTNRLLDSMGDKARQYIADRAEFLGAVRLPNNAFLKNAGTEVTTDIIFLRKLKEGEQPTGQRWMDVKQFTDKNGKTVPLNEYFVRNPDMMLGEFGQYGSMYSPEDAALVARPGQDTPAMLREAIAKLPKGFMDAPTAEPVRETIEPMHDVSHVKIGSVFEQGGQIFERREDMLGKQQAAPVVFASEKAKERVSGMIKVRDALIGVRRMQLAENVSDKALEQARADLNKAYDDFVKANGPINSDANKRLMRDDPTWPQLAALEEKFDKGISAAVAKTTGEKARPASAEKAAIFFKRTQSPYKPPEKAATAKDALVTSLSERGRVDLDYMASLYGKTPDAIAKELDGLVFEAVPGDYVTREEYLSGNVKKRLALTLELAKKFPRFQKNVDALRAVQPADIEAVDIDVKTGSHWVPADVMQDFVSHITEGQNVKAVYNPVTATWTLNAERVPASAATQWGTDRAGVVKVLEAAANQKQIALYDEHRDGTRTLNEAATTAANEKVERVKAEWKSWIWADDTRRARLHRIYNDTFNTDVQRDYDGSHLTFPGKVGNDIIQLRPHQANAVWRMVQSGVTLLDHVVGAGKTFTMIAGIMEMRRMGRAKKPMLVVPNHLVGQWAEDFMKLYPGANILAATKKDFEKDNRKKLFARIATGDWDAVIVAHSSFGKVEVEPEFQEQFIRQQIQDMDTSISAMRAAEGKKSRNVKQIEKQKAALEEKLKKLFDTGSKDDNLYFGELGVDAILLDEAHEFKNLGFSTGMQRVAGLGNPTGSNKAADMFMKVQSVLKRTGGRNVVFATGTPISNTMAEMYTMQRYLDYQTLKDQGIAHFDAWAKTFGEVVTDWELSPSGQYKMNSRFAKFVNMPELMQRYQSFADVINRDDINRQLASQGKKLPVPKVATGKPENIVVERSQDQARYIGIPSVDENGVETYPEGSLIWRSENLPKKAEKGADNMLKIMSDARKAALDMRLIDPNYPDNPASKVNEAAKNIKATYDKWEKDKGTQLVFIDLSTPKGAVAKEAAALRELVKLAEEGDEAAQSKLDAMSPDELLALDSSFSVYDDLKAKLIAQGIPEKEIAFIHDANTELQKEDLFGKVRSGRVRVLFGSTAKMGAGMNVQERLVALHHLDAPWRPSDLEQREGRIIRQGNKLYEADPENFEVEINRYATKQTLDSRMWQTIEAKARFIEQVRKGAGNTREVEDVAGEAANSAEMKAASSGNPLILEEMSLRQAIRKLENQQAEHNREQYRIKDRMRWLGDMAKRADGEAAVMEADAPKAPKAFAVNVGNQTFEKHGEAGEAILTAVDAMHKAGEDSREIGSYGGFSLRVEDASNALIGKKAVLTLTGKGEYQLEANPGSSAPGLGQRLQNTVKALKEEADRAKAQAERDRADIVKLEAQIKPWGHDQELADAKARHAVVIDQLKPKKKEQAKPADGETPAFSRGATVESIFADLEGSKAQQENAERELSNRADADIIRYVNDNFWNILGELESSGKVEINC